MRFLRLSNRPQPVRWAIWLLLGDNVVSLLLSLARAVVDSGTTTGTTLILVGFAAVIDLGLVLAIAFGRRWAFILYVVLFVSGLASFASSLRVDLGHGVPVVAWHVLSLAVDAVGITLLLTPSAREWFAASKVAVVAACRSREIESAQGALRPAAQQAHQLDAPTRSDRLEPQRAQVMRQTLGGVPLSVSLRPVAAADLPAIDRWASVVADRMSRTRPYAEAADRHDPDSGLFWYVIAADDLDVGTVWIELLPAATQAVLGVFLGDASSLGRGIGTTAIGLAIAKFRRVHQQLPIVLRVRCSNARAIACYGRVGFTVTGSGSKSLPSGEVVPYYRMVCLPC